jgi:serine/threonine-protein kinase
VSPSAGDVDRLLDQVLDLPPAERSAWLDRACVEHPTLRAQVGALLAAAEAAKALDGPAHRLMSTEPEVEADASPGDLVGPYRLLHELARGGMGAVYLAERADGQFQQHVALKLIKRGMDTDEILRRFLTERQILARLQHPNIARLLDGGVTAAGRPWYAMEYVDGVPITAYRDAAGLDVGGRIELFAAVCEAVRHAHQNLVVHRDLKPSNILVTAAGQVKLLDFGIAKVLDDTGEAARTGLGVRVMTPAYAAPEQIRGDPITTATDVYALGAVLYELLTGRSAQRFARPTPAEYERVVCHTDPDPPSHAVPGGAPGAARIRRQLRGDLDTVVLKALNKDPARRYPSADALLADLLRYQRGLPVVARPDSPAYRLRKFVARHRIGVGASIALAAALVAGLVGTVWQARNAAAEAAKASEVKEFVKGLFRGSAPVESRGRDITARELLDRGTRRVDSALAGQPAIRLELLHFLGEVHRDLGYYGRADTLLERSHQLAVGLYGERSLEAATELAARGEALWYAGQYGRADSMLAGAVDVYRTRGVPDRMLARALGDRAATLGAQGRHAEAESLYRQELAITRRTFGAGGLETAEVLSNLGVLLWRSDQFASADSALRDALAIRRRSLDPGHPSLLISMHNLATNLLAQGALEEAESLEALVIAGRRALYPRGHPDLAIALQQQHRLETARGRYAEAERHMKEALAINRRWLGPDHPETIAAVANLAVVSFLVGNLEESERATREALAGYRATLGPRHPTTTTVLQNLGVILSERRRYVEAESVLTEALALRRAVLGDSSPDVGQTMRHVAVLRHRTGRARQAERLLREALALERAVLPDDHPLTAEILTSLGAVLTDLGRAREAEPLLRAALAIRRAKHGTEEPRTLETLSALGACLTALGRHREAGPLLLDAYRGLKRTRYGWRQLPAATRHLEAYRRALEGADS